MNTSISSQTENSYTDNKFIMLPTVDICFKSLMNNPKVRKGFIAALLNVEPDTIAETTLLPTALRQDYPDDKLGILDVRASLKDGRQLDMEIQILDLKKLPEELKGDEDIINWMRFLGGKTRREFEAMAKKDEYIDEAYKELERLSADEQAKLEYEAREKAIRDYNSQISSAVKQGKAELIRTMHQNGAEPELIARLTGLSLSEIQQIL